LPSGEHLDLSGNCSIGRTPNNQIQLDGHKVSREHAHIYEIAGKFQLVDAQSTNGTYLNDTKVNRPMILKSGDRILIGKHTLVYVNGEIESAHPQDHLTPQYTLKDVSTMDCWLVLADVVDSTGLLHSLGAEQYALTIGRWFEDCRSAIVSNHGEINKSIGDGLLAFWRDEDNSKTSEVAAALYTLSSLRCPAHPPFRLIVHVGSVTLGGTAQLGEEALGGVEVHKLFRVEKVAGHLQVDYVATEEAALRLQMYFGAMPLGAFELKGFLGTHNIYGLTNAPSEIVHADPVESPA
jgi:class 3 adenylate cyclase